MKSSKAIFFAVLASALYALMTPVSKLMQSSVPPVMEAGLLYLGAGIGMAVIYFTEKCLGKKQIRPSIEREDLRYVIMMVILDVAAPILLMLGLSMSSPESVSLLNNFEIVATAVIASVFFKEKISGRLGVSIAVITLSCILLSLEEGASLSLSKGSVFVVLACICWGLENNCTSSISDKDTRQIVIIKGLGSGAASFVISLVVGEKPGSMTDMIIIMVLGFFAIGLGVYLYVIAQSVIGAARTSSYYAVSPFIGVLISLMIFREVPGMLFWAALVLMAAGVYINILDVNNQDRNVKSS